MQRKLAAIALATVLALPVAPQFLFAAQGASQTPTVAAPTVPEGTRFLVRLEDKLNTKKDKNGKKFKAKTLEPLTANDGSVLPPGAEIRAHLSRVEPAKLTGRARVWMTFDEIKTPGGKMPLIATVVDVPGEASVRAGESKEGDIEARTSKGKRDIEAAAAGAAIGAVAGAAAKGGKGAAIGAALGGVAGFLIASGMGQELELQKGAKLELRLDRPLYVAKKK